MQKQRTSVPRRGRPVIIGVGGSYSGVGKTSVATRILKAFAGWGAIKYTKTSLFSSIIDDEKIIGEEGKDTSRLLDAGAAKVLWVQAPYTELAELLHLAIEMMSHLEGIVVEGNSAVEVARPDIVIFVQGPGMSMKESAKKVLTMADIVVASTKNLSGIPHDALVVQEDEEEELIDRLMKRVAELRNEGKG